ncbi:MAG: DUF975 family protein [Agathobacter sp.]|nr:DUF975 family protein [Agathobacter sp.]
MTRAELKAKAKAQLQGKIGKIFLCMLIVVAISAACNLVPGIGTIASIIIAPALSIGLYLVFLDMTYGKDPEVSTLFNGFQYTGKALWLTILVGVFTFLWALLFYIPGIVKSLSYSMSYYVLAENPNMTAREALNVSKRITNGHKMDLFVLGLSFIPWLLLVMVTCGIAAIYVAPYMQLTITNFYHEIKDQPQVETVVE